MANASKSNDLELKLNELFVDKAPALPEGGKKAIVSWSPWIALVIGILTLLSAITLWHWAHDVSNVANYANQLCDVYGNGKVCGVPASRFSLWIWLAIIVMLAEGILYLLAFPGLRDRKKQGWNYIYYGALLNLVYAVVTLFTSYDVVGHFIGALIGSAIGFYFLFQIRSHFTGVSIPKTPPTTHPKV